MKNMKKLYIILIIAAVLCILIGGLAIYKALNKDKTPTPPAPATAAPATPAPATPAPATPAPATPAPATPAPATPAPATPAPATPAPATPAPTPVIVPIAPTPTVQATAAPIRERAQLNGTRINVRMGPGTEHDILTTLDQNSEVYVTGRTGDWYKVEVGGAAGYIRVDFLKLDSEVGSSGTSSETSKPASTPSATPFDEEKVISFGVARQATVTGTDINLRAAPGTNAKSLTKVSTGDSMYVLGQYSDWYQVLCGDHLGYIRADLVLIY